MIKAKFKYLFSILFRVIVGLVFIISGILKIKKPDEARMAVRAYEVLPIDTANLLGLTLPWVELGLGILLITGIYLKQSSLAGISLFSIFIVAIAQAWARGLSIDCGCFGGGGNIEPSETKYLEEIFRDLIFIFMLIYVNRIYYKKPSDEKDDYDKN